MRRLGRVWLLCVLACGGNEAESPPEDPPATEEAPPETAEETHTETSEPVDEAPAEPAVELVDLLHAVPVTVAAGTAYRDAIGQVERLYDGDLTTAWNSKTGQDGDVLYFVFESAQPLHEVRMTSGYTKTDGDRDLFDGNRRISTVEIWADGRKVHEHTLDTNVRELQTLALPEPVTAARVEVRLTGFVAGANGDWRELCVSEIALMGAAEASPTPRQPTAFLGEPVPADVQAFFREVIARERREDPELQAPDGGPLTTGMGTFQRNHSVRLPRSAPGTCYFAVGEVRHFPGRDEGPASDYYPPEVTWTVGEESDGNVQMRGPLFLVGPSCTEESGGPMSLEIDAQGVRGAYWYAVFSMPDPALGDDNPYLDDTLGNDSDEDLGDDLEPEEPASAYNLTLTDTALGTGVESRALVGERTTFSKASDERVYCFTRIENPDRVATSLYFGWERADRPADPDDSSAWGRANDVPANRHHGTFVYRGTGQRPGEYACVIRDEDGVVLARLPYTLTE